MTSMELKKKSKNELIELANKRIAENPGKYFTPPGESQPRLYGYSEVGGVNVLLPPVKRVAEMNNWVSPLWKLQV